MVSIPLIIVKILVRIIAFLLRLTHQVVVILNGYWYKLGRIAVRRVGKWPDYQTGDLVAVEIGAIQVDR